MKVYQGEIGKTFIVDAGEDLAGYRSIKIHITKPDGTQVDWIPQSVSGQTCSYKSKIGDLDQIGIYDVNYVEYRFINGDLFYGNSDKFRVHKKG